MGAAEERRQGGICGLAACRNGQHKSSAHCEQSLGGRRSLQGLQRLSVDCDSDESGRRNGKLAGKTSE